VLGALVALRETGERLRPLVTRALADSLASVREAALIDLEVTAVSSSQRSFAREQVARMLRDPDAGVRQGAARLLGRVDRVNPF
jgi:HEAT repeat protein